MGILNSRPGRWTGKPWIAGSGAIVAMVAFVALLSGCGGGSSDGGDGTSVASTKASDVAGDCKELNVFTWEAEAPNSIVKPFEKKYGVKVNIGIQASGDQALAKLAAGGTEDYDIVVVESDNRQAMVDAGMIQPLDTSKLDYYDDILPFLKEPFTIDGKVYAVASDWGANPFIYNTQVLKKTPTSWDVLWDPQLKGQVSIWSDYSMLYVGAAVLGIPKEDLFDMSDDQLEAVKEKMLELGPNIRKPWTSGGDLIQLFANGEVSASMGWTYIYNQLKNKIPVKQILFKDHGAQAWAEGPALTSGIDEACVPLAYAFINALTSPEGQAKFTESTGYIPANPKAKAHLSPQLIKETGINDPQTALGGSIIRLDPADRQKYVDTSEEILAGLQ